MSKTGQPPSNESQTSTKAMSCQEMDAALDVQSNRSETGTDEMALNSQASRGQHSLNTGKEIDGMTQGIGDTHSLEIKLSKRRWVVLTSLALCNFANAFLWISIASISSIIHKNYKVSYEAVYWSSKISMVFQVLFSAPMSFLVKRIGLKTALVISTALNAIGGALQYLASYETSPNSYLILFCGRIFPSFCFAIQFPLPPKLSATWFGDKERVTATSICVLLGYLGVGFGFLVPALLLANASNNEEVVERLRTLGLGLNILLVPTFLFTVAFVRDRPLNPPSQSEWRRRSESFIMKKSSTMEKSGMRCKNFFKLFQFLVKCKGYLLLSQSSALYFAIINAWSTVLQQMVTVGFPDKIAEVGWMGCNATLVATIGTLLVGVVVDKTKQYKATSIILWASSFVCTLAFTSTLTMVHNIIPAFVIYIIWGLVGMPWLGLSFEYVADITYPVPEEITTSISLTFSGLYSFALTYVAEALLRDMGSAATGYTIAGFYGLGLLFVVIAKPEMRRSKAEQMEDMEQSY